MNKPIQHLKGLLSRMKERLGGIDTKGNAAEEILGMRGRMISSSKSGYIDRNPDNVVVFNANVCVRSGKIWHGDLDLTLSKEKLIDLSSFIGDEIYVLYEMDARFENEDSPLINEYVAKFSPDGSYKLRDSLREYKSL
jgi:hypothetical protein